MAGGPDSPPKQSPPGFQSAHALPMRLPGTVIGGLSLFRAGPGKMGAGDIEVAQAFADVATIAILQHRAAYEAQVINEQLNKAPEGRIVIEQAKGRISEGLGVDM